MRENHIFIETIPTGTDSDITVSIPSDHRMPLLCAREHGDWVEIALDQQDIELLILVLKMALDWVKKNP